MMTLTQALAAASNARRTGNMVEYKAAMARYDALKAERVSGRIPAAKPAYAVCCAKARVVGGCVCSHVSDCPDHGVRHHGTHD